MAKFAGRLLRDSAFAVVFLCCFTPGLCNFKFTFTPKRFYTVGLNLNFNVNCSTNDPNGTTSLYHRPRPGMPWNKLTPQPKELLKDGNMFVVLDFGLKDAGQYQCRATNQAGVTIQWSDNICPMVFAKPDVTPNVDIYPKHAVVLTSGESFNFTCKSVTRTMLKWIKQPKSGPEMDVPPSQTVSAKNLDKNELTLILMIKNAQLSDSSVYKCLMTYSNKQNYKLASLTVYRKEKPVITDHSSSAGQVVTVQEPGSTEIFCKAKAHPKPTFRWYKNGKQISIRSCDANINMKCEDGKYVMRLDSSTSTESTAYLSIKAMKFPDDHGQYVCAAKNSAGIVRASMSINVEVKPILYERKDAFLQSKGISGEVHCKTLRSNPLATFKWEFQNKGLVCAPKCTPNPFMWQNLRSFTVRPVTSVPTNLSSVIIPAKQVPAFFRCTATNKIGSSNWTVGFERLDDPGENLVQIKQPGNAKLINIDEGQPIVIHCITITQLAALNGIRWLHGKKVLPPTNPRVTISYNNLDDKKTTEVIFTLFNTTVNDTGMYTCDAIGLRAQGRIINDTINVSVADVTPPVISGMVDQTVRMEDTKIVELNCKTTGHPTPAIQWFKQTPQGWSKMQGIEQLLRTDSCKQSTRGYYFYSDSNGNPLVICRPKHDQHSGTYKCVATNKEGTDKGITTLDVQEGAKVLSPKSSKEVFVTLGTQLNQTCIANGNPAPEVQWSRPDKSGKSGDKVLASGTSKVLLVIKKVTAEDLVNYTCTASNYKSSSIIFAVKESEEGNTLAAKAMSEGALAGIITGCALFVVVILIICFIVYRRQKKQIDEYKEFYFLRAGQSDYKIDPDRSLLEQCNNLPYDLDWEFPEERLILGKILGQGAFGQVLRAEALGMDTFNPRDKTPDALRARSKMRRSLRGSMRKRNEYASMRLTKTTVAVKCLKDGASESDYKDLASELKILIHLGEHKNIVNVLGACTRGRRVMVIIEYAPYGNLLTFLRARREVYQPTWTKTTSDPDREYTLVDLAMASYQVSKGVEFLASRKCVHRDLAARNVLVGPNYVMKVSDFGLARDIYQDDLYVKTTSGLLPVKWMALESLFDRVYTEKSDVWSFGILLWEMFTLGGTPYPGLPTEQLLDYLSEGQRMAQPQNCPLDLYAIMRDCWMQLPEQRPDFVTLSDRLGKILERNIAKDNPYIQLMIDESTGTTDYYLNPCDAHLQEKANRVDGYEEALPTPRAESALRYDTPLPSLPPDESDEDIANSPLPSIPPSYEEATKPRNSSGRSNSRSSNESGIDVEDKGKNPEEERLLVDLPEHDYYNETKGKGKGKGKKRHESLV